MQGNGKGSPTQPAACIDAETLAAWADGGLPRPEAAAVEVHLADCERCTAMAATFARTIPEPPATESLWKRWHLRWLVPVATAATVASLYVLIPDRPISQTATVSSALQDEQRAQPQAPAQQSQAAPESQPAPAAEAKRQETSSRTKPSGVVGGLVKGEDAPAADDERQANQAAGRLESRTVNETVTQPAPPAREADRADLEPPVMQARERVAPTPPAGVATAPAAAAPAAPAAGPQSSALAAAARARGATGVRDQTALLEVVSPDPMTRWRVALAGQVERSTTGGARWERATLPESATLTGGSSPATSICWLVGRAGAIYVTTDGLRFSRVPFPDRVDVLSIQAIDARRATVVTSDGRTLRTEDQGATWIRVAP